MLEFSLLKPAKTFPPLLLLIDRLAYLFVQKVESEKSFHKLSPLHSFLGLLPTASDFSSFTLHKCSWFGGQSFCLNSTCSLKNIAQLISHFSASSSFPFFTGLFSQWTNISKCLTISTWLNKLWHIHPNHIILLKTKMEQIIDTLSNLDETQRYYAEWKQSQY